MNYTTTASPELGTGLESLHLAVQIRLPKPSSPPSALKQDQSLLLETR